MSSPSSNSVVATEPTEVAVSTEIPLSKSPELFSSSEFSPELVERINEQIRENRLSVVDFDEFNISGFGQLTAEARLAVINEYAALRNTSWITNRAAYLSNLIQKHQAETAAAAAPTTTAVVVDSSSPPPPPPPAPPASVPPSPQKEQQPSEIEPTIIVDKPVTMKSIAEKSGYPYEITSSQRRYGPAPDADPTERTELYVGRLPKTLGEEKLIPIFEEIGKIWDLRYLVNPYDGLGRGFCFVNYCKKDDAQKAIEKLDGFEIETGVRISVSKSDTQNVLYVRGIPRSKRVEEVKSELSKCIEGIVRVDVTAGRDTPNRGFCFVHFESQRTAAIAKKKISGGRYRFFDRDLLADWSDCQVDPESASRVRALFVAKLTTDVSESDLRDAFQPHGAIERIKQFDSYGFVHFVSREEAQKALEAFRSGKIGDIAGVKVDVEFAKPLNDLTKTRRSNYQQQHHHPMRDFPNYQRRGPPPNLIAPPMGPPPPPPPPPPPNPFPLPFVMENSAFFANNANNHSMGGNMQNQQQHHQQQPSLTHHQFNQPQSYNPYPIPDQYAQGGNKRRYRSLPQFSTSNNMNASDPHHSYMPQNQQFQQSNPFQQPPPMFSPSPWTSTPPKRFRNYNRGGRRHGGRGNGNW